MNIEELRPVLLQTPVVPLVKAEDPATAIEISRALAAGGLPVVEVLFRTDRALECLKAVASDVPEVIAGAGTVLTAEQARQALDSGAKFIVSPGLDDDVVRVSVDGDAAVFPGVATAGEFQHAHKLGLDIVKFFPASIAGGVAAIKAFAGVFRHMRIMPTGGISAANLADYLSLPSVLACGGSWLTPDDAVAGGDFDTITRLAEEATAIAAKVRGKES